MTGTAVRSRSLGASLAGVLLLVGCGAADGEDGPTATGGEDRPVDDGASLMVGGFVDLDQGEIEYGSTRLLPVKSAPDPPAGPYDLVLLDPDGDLIRRVPFDVIEQHDAERPIVRFSVAVHPAPDEPIGRLVIERDGHQVAQIPGSASRPAVRIDQPTAGQEVSAGDVRVSWTGTDDDGDDLFYYVYFSADGGQRWRALFPQIRDQEVILPRSEVTPTQDALVIVSVSDGVNATYTLSPTFTIVP